MSPRNHPRVLVAHRRPPVLRMIRTNLEADGLPVRLASTAGACLAALRSGPVDALVLDADLIRTGDRERETLLRYLLQDAVPTLVVSWDPKDHLLARTLHDAPFISRLDNVDRVTACVHDLLGATLQT